MLNINYITLLQLYISAIEISLSINSRHNDWQSSFFLAPWNQEVTLPLLLMDPFLLGRRFKMLKSIMNNTTIANLIAMGLKHLKTT